MVDASSLHAKDGAISPKVAVVIENIGAGLFQLKEITLGGSIWLAAGSQIIMITALTLNISKEWNLKSWERSSIVSILFIGIMLGNFASGPCSDLVGRRPPILISYATICFFSVASACSTSFWVLFFMRLLLGIAFGFSQPAWNTLCSEITPSRWRMYTAVLSSLLFVVGEIYAASLIWLEDPEMKSLNWQALTVFGTMPAAIMGVACVFFLNESASWLALQGQADRAKQVLESIRWWNRKEEVSLDFASSNVLEPVSSSPQQQMEVATGKVLGFTTFVLCSTCFTLNFIYYGSFYSFPLVLGDVDMGVSPAVALIIGALWELPGYAAAIGCSMVCGRRVAILSYLVLMMLSTLLFVEGAEHQKSGNAVYGYAVHVGFAGMKCWINMGFVIVYQYASEIYPTSARVAGTGLCFGCGRIGSMVAPFVFEAMMDAFNNSWQNFYYLLAMACAANAILVLFLPFETASMTLKDHVAEMGEMDPLVSCGARKAQ